MPENMHTLMEMNQGTGQGTHVPAFLAKLWKLVDDPATNDLIYWSETGNSFVIRNQAKFSRELLPLYYKHNNMASFVRQLNMYGFHKVVSVEQGGLKLEKDEMEFAHPFFLRGHEGSLELIKRKIPAPKHDDARNRPDNFQKVLMDVRQMKGRQETMDSKLLTMKRENEALWRELAALRQKHANQTTILSKILQFLVGVMSSRSHRLGFKRRMPLMLNDTADGDGSKERKIGRQQGPTGPVIHDVTEIFEEDVSGDEGHSDYLTGSSGSDGDTHPKVDSPLSATAKSPYSADSLLGFEDHADLLLGVDPTTVNPSRQQQQQETMAEVKPKMGRKTPRKTNNSFSATTTSQQQQQQSPPIDVTNVLSNEGGMGQQIPIVLQGGPQSLSPFTSTAGSTQHPTNYYIAGADGEPMQVYLSIPDQQQSPVKTSDIGVNTESVASTTPTATVTQAPIGAPSSTQTVSATTDMVPVNREDFDAHLDDMQVGLDNLRDLLKTDDYKLDSSTLLGVSWPLSSNSTNSSNIEQQLFGEGGMDLGNLANLDLAKQLQLESGANGGGGNGGGMGGTLTNQELVSYNPSLFELTEDDSQFFDDSSNMFLDDELESMLTTDRDKLVKHTTAGSMTAPFTAGGGASGLTTPVVGPSSVGVGGATAASLINNIAAGSSAGSNVTGAGRRKRK